VEGNIHNIKRATEEKIAPINSARSPWTMGLGRW